MNEIFAEITARFISGPHPSFGQFNNHVKAKIGGRADMLSENHQTLKQTMNNATILLSFKYKGGSQKKYAAWFSK